MIKSLYTNKGVSPKNHRLTMLIAISLTFVFELAVFAQGAKEVKKGGIVVFEFPYGSVRKDSVWLDTMIPIPVCWENPTINDAHFRAIVRRAVESTWVKHSRLSFSGWSACVSNSPGIRIRISDDRPHVKTLGKYLNARPDGMVLNFSFEKWGSNHCTPRIEFCVWAVAVHEFGHAIGFAHEQNRDDAPPECQADSQGTKGDWNLTEYDPYSIMNYCNPHWNGDGFLSLRDIDAVQKLYKKP